MKQIYLYLSIPLFIFACSREQQNTNDSFTDELGEIQFDVQATPEAQEAFKKGLLLLHSFEYEDAETAFLAAQQLDSTLIMAYWGEAMTHNHPLWRQQDKEKAQKALGKLGKTPEERLAKVPKGLERDLWQAAEILYGEESGKKERDKTYSDYLQSLYQKYPNNHEVAAFYALSVLGAVPVGRDEAAYGKGALVAQSIIEENPKHPGALHYLIHSYDDPTHAKLALNAANSYSKVAPDAAHALHMPSHIYVALGMWNEVINSNIASFEASVKRKKRKELDEDAQSYHALHWLMYGYTQKGNMEEAKNLMKQMKDYVDKTDSKRARDYLISMKGNYLVESNEWDGEIATYTARLDDLNISTQAIDAYLEGKKVALKNDLDSLKRVIGKMEMVRQKASNIVSEEGIAMCSSASNNYAPNQQDINQAHIIEMELKALLAQKEGKREESEKWLQLATELQENTSYAYGPPPIVQPSFEMYAEWLMEQKRDEEALTMFDKALAFGPKRLKALKGKLTALENLGEQKKAEELKKLLKEQQSNKEFNS